jgi:hypothetical protein
MHTQQGKKPRKRKHHMSREGERKKEKKPSRVTNWKGKAMRADDRHPLTHTKRQNKLDVN